MGCEGLVIIFWDLNIGWKVQYIVEVYGVEEIFCMIMDFLGCWFMIGDRIGNIYVSYCLLIKKMINYFYSVKFQLLIMVFQFRVSSIYRF